MPLSPPVEFQFMALALTQSECQRIHRVIGPEAPICQAICIKILPSALVVRPERQARPALHAGDRAAATRQRPVSAAMKKMMLCIESGFFSPDGRFHVRRVPSAPPHESLTGSASAFPGNG